MIDSYTVLITVSFILTKIVITQIENTDNSGGVTRLT